MFSKKTNMTICATTLGIAMLSTIDAYAAQKGIVLADTLNIRSGPSLEYPIVTKVTKNTTLDITETSNGWHKVKLPNGQIGWASSQYVNSNNVSSSPINKKGQVIASTLNVRTGASTSNSVLTKINKGTTVDVLESSNGWYKIKLLNGQIGWVSSQYITFNNISSSPINKKGQVIASTLNVRTGASTSNSVLTKINKGTTVDVLESSNGWYKIKLLNGQIGWVSSQYITFNISYNESQNSTTNDYVVSKVINLAKAQIGKPYLWGAEGPNAFDCSGFTYYVFKNAANIILPRTSSAQGNFGVAISKNNMKPGDLVLFDSTKDGRINHVGIYIGNNSYIHSPSSGKTIRIDSTSGSYFTKNLTKIRRVL